MSLRTEKAKMFSFGFTACACIPPAMLASVVVGLGPLPGFIAGPAAMRFLVGNKERVRQRFRNAPGLTTGNLVLPITSGMILGFHLSGLAIFEIIKGQPSSPSVTQPAPAPKQPVSGPVRLDYSGARPVAIVQSRKPALG